MFFKGSFKIKEEIILFTGKNGSIIICHQPNTDPTINNSGQDDSKRGVGFRFFVSVIIRCELFNYQLVVPGSPLERGKGVCYILTYITYLITTT